jgi:undecaprenyl-diphosphatase
MARFDFSSWREVTGWRPAWTMAEFGILAAIVLIAGTGLAIFELAEEISQGETHAFDTAILLAFRNPADTADPIGPWWLEQMMKDVTALGGTSVLTLITVVALGYLLIERKYHAAAFLLVAIVGGTLLSSLLKLGFDRPRPDLVAHGAQVYSASFPSGHALMSAAAYLTLGALLARVQKGRRLKLYFLSVAVALTMLIGVSRVYLGVHWPTDVLAGWCIGSAWALSCWLIAMWLQRRGEMEGSGDEAASGAPG